MHRASWSLGLSEGSAGTPSRPRVLVWQWGRFGAGPRYALELAHALRTYCGLETQLSLAEDAEVLQHPVHRAAVDLPVTTYRSPFEFIAKSLAINKVLAPTIQALRANPPDVAISMMPAYWDVFFAARLRRLGVPTVTVIHDATMHPGDWFPLIPWLQRRLIAESAAVITPSDFVGNRLRERNWLNATPTTIPLVAFDFSELNLAPPAPPSYSERRPLRLLLAGRLKIYKGLQLFFASLERLTPQDVHVRVAGPVQDRAALEKLHPKHQVETQFGWLSDAEFIANIDWADAVVVPYIEASQSGIIPMAFKRARPVIATPTGGLPEQVEDRVTGLLAREVSPQAVVEAIKTFIDQPDLLRACAQGALRKASGLWSWAQVAPRFAGSLCDVVRSHAPSRRPADARVPDAR
jgi:glycosyltransferase involved in cell wall biosynthesis